MLHAHATSSGGGENAPLSLSGHPGPWGCSDALPPLVIGSLTLVRFSVPGDASRVEESRLAVICLLVLC